MSKTEEEIRAHGLDSLSECAGIIGADLHNRLYNEDYYVIGTYQATQDLEAYGTFEAIEKVKAYEQDSFGEVNTDFSDPEKILNMLAYVIGEEFLGGSDTLRDKWNDELTNDDLAAIATELESQA